MIQFNFVRTKTSACGRNKDIRTVGLALEMNPELHLVLKPLTTKGTVSNNAFLAIPKEDIPTLIMELQKLI